MSDQLFVEQYKTDLDIAYLSALSKSDDRRVVEQKRQHEYYKGDWGIIQPYLETALKKVWRDYTVKRMPKSYLNITDKIIDSSSMIYIQSPKRRLYKDDKQNNEFTKYFNKILSPTLNKFDKQTHRIGKLHNTAVPFITYKNGKFHQSVGSSWLYTAYTNYSDFDDLGKITYNKYFPDPITGSPALFTVVWTDAEHYMVDSYGNQHPVPGNEDTINPYGTIPVPYLRFDDPENDFWGEGQNVLVNESENINLLLTKLNYDDIIMGTAGMLFGINLGEITTNNENGDAVIHGGRDAIIQSTTKQHDRQQTDLKYVNTEPQIEEVIKAIDWKIKIIAMSMGLNPNNFSVETKAESGYSRLVASYEQGEVRQDDIDSCREYELRRFDIIRKMNNRLVKGNFVGTENLMHIPDDLELVIDFLEVTPQTSGTELWADRAEREKRNMGTPAKWIMEDNPDIRTEEEALEIIEHNTSINDVLGTHDILADETIVVDKPGDGRETDKPTASGKKIGDGMKESNEN